LASPAIARLGTVAASTASAKTDFLIDVSLLEALQTLLPPLKELIRVNSALSNASGGSTPTFDLGRADQKNLIEALDSGADDFIGKPPLAEELYARLRAAERIASMQRELICLATTDPLTGLCNRRGFFERATEVCERTISTGRVSLDNFKRINDSYGHDTGDEAIRACARAASAKEGLVGRLGGDEFALLLEERRFHKSSQSPKICG
jgi:PleD family two-component response regulator